MKTALFAAIVSIPYRVIIFFHFFSKLLCVALLRFVGLLVGGWVCGGPPQRDDRRSRGCANALITTGSRLLDVGSFEGSAGADAQPSEISS